jgi:hypothetical protein
LGCRCSSFNDSICSSDGTAIIYPLIAFARSSFDADATRFTFACTNGEVDMLWTIFVVLVILWLLGLSLHVGGSLVHLLLVVGLVILVINLLSGRRSAI